MSAGKVICGHTSEHFTCYLRPDHAGLHEETHRLRDGSIERTNWGSDGLAPWATKDRRDPRPSEQRLVDGLRTHDAHQAKRDSR